MLLSLYNEKIANCCEPLQVQEYSKNIQRITHLREAHLNRIAKGAMIRSRCKWYTEAGTSSKYFLNLEKAKYSNKTMKYLIKQDSTIERDHKKILQEQLKFYQQLYSSDRDVYFTYTNYSNTKLTEEDKMHLDHEISKEELSQAIFAMSNDKSCGIDGLPVEVYKVFYAKLSDYLLDAINYAIDIKGKLHLSARRGILSLIPKKREIA